jgi:hypothetical protein
MASNGSMGSRVYVSYLATDATLRVVGFATDDFDTFDFDDEPGDIEYGLDIEWNGFPSANPLVFSGIRSDGRVRVYGFDIGSNIDTLYPIGQISNGAYTALACKFDTVFVMFDREQSTVTQARYLVRYGDVTLWYQGGIGDTLLGFSRSGDATGRWDNGIAVTYWQYPQSSKGQMYRHRPYAQSAWSDPERIQTLNTMSLPIPSIERVAPDCFGVVFYRAIDGGKALFNRNAWTGIAEPEVQPGAKARTGPTVLRGILELKPGETGTLVDAAGRRIAGLVPGENDLRHLSPGVYFVHRDGDALPAKVVLQK